ncbi:sigma factor-like helix-turn-helix DNA-binding protein [Kibdelosporangium persicum]|uniref:sigma factor-like helix-turn-helix DNA-binding protein n=1 Tax=Kibdelosporangium persicum TaxID=2698649 RepID=UPI0024837278
MPSPLVADALRRLTADQRTVIVRAFFLGQSVAELATLLNVPPDIIRARMYYGLRALHLALQQTPS